MPDEHIISLIARSHGYVQPYLNEEAILYVTSGYAIADKETNVDKIVLENNPSDVHLADVMWQRQELEKLNYSAHGGVREMKVLATVAEQWSHGITILGWRIHYSYLSAPWG